MHPKSGPTRNIACEVRIYVRAITRALMQQGLLQGMISCHSAPAEYWKSFTTHRSPEFLADTKMALKFAQTYFCREHIVHKSGWVYISSLKVDVEVFCNHLRGPVLYALPFILPCQSLLYAPSHGQVVS